MSEFRMLTLNMHKGLGPSGRRFVLPQLRDAVRDEKADLVFLQEAMDGHGGYTHHYPDWLDRPQHEFMAMGGWDWHAWGRNEIYPQGHMCNAVLSRFPIARQMQHDVSIRGQKRRSLLHCVIDIPGDAMPVHAICAHLGLRESDRRRQIGMLSKMIEEEVPAGAPLVIAGDFNDWRRRGHALMQAAGLREAFAERKGRVARTFPARFPVLSLDRVYLRNARIKDIRVLSTAPWTKLSDHAGLSVTFEV